MTAQRRRGAIVFLLGLTAVVSGIVTGGIGCRRDDGLATRREERSASAAPEEAIVYTCPMHPSVRQTTPGRCPLCGMDLAAVAVRAGEAGGDGTVLLDGAQRRRAGIRTARVAREALAREVRAFGRVVYDETRLHDVVSRQGGKVTRLHVSWIGEQVAAGQVLLTLYSPELYAAQQEYLLARRRLADGAGSAAALLAAARRRLVLWDLPASVLETLDRSAAPLVDVPVVAPASGFVVEKTVVAGAAVAPRERLYRIAALEAVWIEADVDADDLPYTVVGGGVTIALPALAGRSLAGTIAAVSPTVDEGSRRGRIRIAVDNPDLALRPGMLADVALRVPLGERLAVPAAAVVYTGPRRIVFVERPDGRFEPREVRLGARAGDRYEVLGGLADGDAVVVAGNFLVGAESRLRATAAGGGDHAAH